MKILQIASGNFLSTFGGGQVYVKNIVDQMIDMHLDVEIVSLVKGVAGVHQKDYRGVRLTEIGRQDSLADIIKMVNPDIIHAHSLKAAACNYGREFNIPVVVTAHHGGILCPAGNRLLPDDEICQTPLSHTKCLPCVLRNIPAGLSLWYPLMKHFPENVYDKIGKTLQMLPFIPFVSPIGGVASAIRGKSSEWKEIAAGCTRMISPSADLALAMTINGLTKEKIVILPHGTPEPPNAEHHKYDGTLRLFYAGRICYDKGIHTLLEAFSLTVARNVELHIIGSASNKRERRYLNRLQKQYKDSQQIVWHGKIAPNKVYETIAGFDVAISASLLESFGLNIAEALAMGKPVIATKCGGAEMQITDGVNGWLVDRNNPRQMAERIYMIAHNPAILQRISPNCQAITMEEHCNALLKIYEETCAD